jgi:hypothetical protein
MDKALEQHKDVLDRVKKYLDGKFQTDSSTKDYNERVQSLIKNLDKAIIKKCSMEYESLTKYAKLANNPDGSPSINFNPGQEEQGREAYSVFTGCSKEFAGVLTELQAMDNINAYTVNDQLNNCTLDCLGDSDVEKCMTKCVDFTYNYTYKAIRNLMSIQVDRATEQINKFI